jgi:Superinfection exclusion gene product 17
MSNKKLKVWWAPQVSMKPFYVSVDSVLEAQKILDTLAEYDLFQFENRVRRNYANAGGLQEFHQEIVDNSDGRDDGWYDWCDEETGEDNVKRYLEVLKSKL